MGTTPQARADRGSVSFVDLLEFAVDQANDGIAIMRLTEDPEVPIRIVYANSEIERLSGFSREELLDHTNPFLRVQPQNRPRYLEHLSQVRSGKSVRFEIALGGKDRSTWTEIRWSPLEYRGEHVTHYVAVLREHAIETLADGAAIVEPSDTGSPHAVYATPALCGQLQLSCEKILARDLAELIGEIPHEGAFERERMIECGDGVSRWFHLRGLPQHAESGRIERITVIFRDIDEQHRKASESRVLESALNLAQEPIAVYTVTGSLELELQHKNRASSEYGTPLIEKLVGDPVQHARVADAYGALQAGESVNRLVHTGLKDPRRWVNLEIRLLNSRAGAETTTVVVIEHRLKKSVTWETDDIATMLALSNEVLHLKNPDARRDAFAEIMRREWSMNSMFRRVDGLPGVALRGKEGTGSVSVRAGVFFDEPSIAEFSWMNPLPSYRLTALRVFLETFSR